MKLISPAPGGAFGLAYGNTSVRPYNPSRPHRGQDWEREWRDLSKPRPVVAPCAGRVTRVWSDGRYNDGWGNRVEITVPSSSHRIVAALNHLETGTIRVRVGQDVDAGQYIGEMGATGETAGVHLHEELWINGERVNPNTYRTRDLPGTPSLAGSNARPLPTPPPPQEDTMTVSINLNGRHLLAVGQEFVSHHGTGSQAEITRKVMSITDEEHRLNTAQFHDLLDGLGIPRWIVNVDNGQVWNPEKKVYEHNGVWSRQRELLAKLDELAKTPAAKS